MKKRYPICSISRLRMGIDGEGIRTLVAMQGCPLRCKYCINPQTRDYDNTHRMMTADDVYSEISIDRPYILATNGGITFGGGEPLLYPEIINEMKNICDSHMTIYVETSLHVLWENIEEAMGSIDKYIVDIKTMDTRLYKQYTGKNLSVSLFNLQSLLRRVGPEKIIVRIPEIEGIVDETIQRRAQYKLQAIGVKEFDLFKYKILY